MSGNLGVPPVGVRVIETANAADERGSFHRVWDQQMLSSQGISFSPIYSAISTNAVAGTLRGLHFQVDPFGESKLVTCVKGVIFDVAVDVRRTSPTFGAWFGVQLMASEPRSLFIPKGFAHGFQTLEDDSHVLYHIEGEYEPTFAATLRWDDPDVGIVWPQAVPSRLSGSDRAGMALFGIA